MFSSFPQLEGQIPRGHTHPINLGDQNRAQHRVGTQEIILGAVPGIVKVSSSLLPLELLVLVL